MNSSLWTEPEMSVAGAKDRGAYYTDGSVAEYLVWWAIRDADDRVMDPSFGGGVFLRAAASRLCQLGGQPATLVFGAEVDRAAHRAAVAKLATSDSLDPRKLFHADFFSLPTSDRTQVKAIVGNPPFIRYQRFTGAERDLALKRSAEQGVLLTRLTSSWAPFVVHSVGMLQEGGRLAMVVPREIAYAKYARPVLEFLRGSFRQVTFLTFRERLFSHLSEDTILLLADDKGNGPAKFLVKDCQDAAALSEMQAAGPTELSGAKTMHAQEFADGRRRFVEYLIPKKASDLYRQLAQSANVSRLRSLADVGIGYVSGANEFFHLAPSEVMRLGLPFDSLKPIVKRAKAFAGTRFTEGDWLTATNQQEAAYLLHIDKSAKISGKLKTYLQEGERRGISQSYKCRSRTPWYSVPHVYRPDAFLAYMSGLTPQFVANEAGAFASNTLHIVRFKNPSGNSAAILAMLWQSSLTHLSVEIEGHALGGGMLKLEPKEAGNVLIPYPIDINQARFEDLASEVDALTRRGNLNDAYRLVDREILQKALGLSVADCQLLASAAARLKVRRGCGGFTYDAA